LLGLGLGAIFATLHEFGNAIEHVAGLLLRFIYFASGIFYVPAMMPVFARDILIWNPFLHIIDFNRMGYFGSYAPFWNDFGYALITSLFVFTLGFVCLAAISRHMRSHL
jgi:capsular polysaccharide transport system permease protein